MFLPRKNAYKKLGLLLFFLASTRAWSQSTEAPAQILDDISKGLLSCKANSHPKGYDSESIAKKYFESKLAVAFLQTQENTDDFYIDWDVFVADQDCQVANVKIEFVKEENGEIFYRMNFTNFGREKTVEYDFRAVNSDWKIWDIRYPVNGFSLRKTLDLK